MQHLSAFRFPTSAGSWIFLLALPPSVRFWRGPFPALYLSFRLESVHSKLFAHRLVLLFYALSYLCSIFDSSAGKKISRKLPTATESKLRRPRGGGSGGGNLSSTRVVLRRRETAPSTWSACASAQQGAPLRRASAHFAVGHAVFQAEGLCAGFPWCPGFFLSSTQGAWPVTVSWRHAEVNRTVVTSVCLIAL